MCIWAITGNLRLLTQLTECKRVELPCVAGESFAPHNICKKEVVSISQGWVDASVHLHRRRRQPENAPVITGSDSKKTKEIMGCRMCPHACFADQIIITM